MSDPFEDFVRENRKEFDIHEPGTHVWKDINQNLSQKKRLKVFKFMGVAASFIVLIAAAYLFGLNKGENELNKHLFASETQYEEFVEAKQYYNRTIDYKMSEVKKIGVDKDVLSDLQQLDEVYQELKEEMLNSEYKDKELIMKLMINNYETKIEILERIISKTKKAQLTKNKNNEIIDI